jgi:hypothetical protein
MSITVLDVLYERAPELRGRKDIPASEFDKHSLPFTAVCQSCHATLGAHNAYPSKTGDIRCNDCIGDLGFEAVREFNARAWR